MFRKNVRLSCGRIQPLGEVTTLTVWGSIIERSNVMNNRHV